MNTENSFKNKERINNLNHYGSLVNLAFVDGEFVAEEYDLLQGFAKKLGITADEQKMILDNPENFSAETIDDFSKRMGYVYDFFKIIYADHRLDETEYQLVMMYVQKLGFNNVQAKTIINRSIEIYEKDISEEDFEILVLKRS